MTGQPLSPASQQASQELSPAQLTPVTLAQSHTLQTPSTQQGAVQHTYIPGNWNYRGYREFLPPPGLNEYNSYSNSHCGTLQIHKTHPAESMFSSRLSYRPVTG